MFTRTRAIFIYLLCIIYWMIYLLTCLIKFFPVQLYIDIIGNNITEI
jgi:hypothetical protein